MESIRHKLVRLPNLCLICGVDSGPIKVFLFGFIGCLVLASVCFIVWGIATKRFSDDTVNNDMALRAEGCLDE